MAEVTGSLTDCTICMEVLNNPRFLPCHHTFCLQCIEGLIHSNRPNRQVPCPLCRSHFNAPASGLRSNVYAEELVRLIREDKRRNNQLEIAKNVIETVRSELQMVKDELAAVTSQLEETEGARQETIAEKRELEEALEETAQKLKALENQSSEVVQRLESKVAELERNLSAAETREACLREVQRETVEQLKDAERRREAAKNEAETYRLAAEQAEASSANLEESCRSLQHQLDQTQRDTCQQIRDAEHRQREAEVEAKTSERAKNGIQASLAKSKRSYQNLKQYLQQVQQETTEQTETLQTELEQSKQEVINLNERLKIESLKLDQQEDYKKAHTEVVRFCFVLLALLLLATIGALVLLEDRSLSTVKAKEKQWVACQGLAQRLEENAAKLTAVRYETRNLTRTLEDCSNQLVTTKRSLQTTEKKLEDANAFLISFGKEYIKDNAGETVKRTSHSEITADSKCRQELAEARTGLETQKSVAQNCSSRLAQERESKLLASARAEECLVQRNWLQKRLDENTRLFSRRLAEKYVETGAKIEGENRDRYSQESNEEAKDFHTGESGSNEAENAETPETAELRNTAEFDRGIGRNTEECADLKAQELALHTCTRNLREERRERLLAFESIQECSRELHMSENMAKLKTASLTQCEHQLKEIQCNSKTLSGLLERREKELSSKSKDVLACEKRAKKCQGDSTELTKCNEKLTTASDTVRWKRQQLDKCVENLVKTEEKVQKLKDLQAESESIQETLIEDLNIRHQEKLDDIVLNLHRRHKEELEIATIDCAVQQIWDPIFKSIAIILSIFVLCVILIPVTANLFMFLAYLADRFRTLVGIRGRLVEFGVNFRNPRYRR